MIRVIAVGAGRARWRCCWASVLPGLGAVVKLYPAALPPLLPVTALISFTAVLLLGYARTHAHPGPLPLRRTFRGARRIH